MRHDGAALHPPFPQTPAAATDAELAAMFQLIDADSSETRSADRGACAAAGIHNRGVLLVPDRGDDEGRNGGAPSEPPFRSRCTCDDVRRARELAERTGLDAPRHELCPFCRRVVGAFRSFAPAVAAVLNR